MAVPCQWPQSKSSPISSSSPLLSFLSGTCFLITAYSLSGPSLPGQNQKERSRFHFYEANSKTGTDLKTVFMTTESGTVSLKGWVSIKLCFDWIKNVGHSSTTVCWYHWMAVKIILCHPKQLYIWSPRYFLTPGPLTLSFYFIYASFAFCPFSWAWVSLCNNVKGFR